MNDLERPANKMNSNGEVRPAAECDRRIAVNSLGVAKITVVGVGGGGCNTVSHMFERHPGAVNYVCANTDANALRSLKRDGLTVLPIGEALTRGFGAGGNPEVGEQAALADRAALKKALAGSDIVFIASGMGGGTGTGAAPVVAEIAKQTGALTIAMVTLPFSWEGHRRMETALGGLSRLRAHVDNVVYIHNDMIAQLVHGNATVHEAFKVTDQAITDGIMMVNEVVNTPGEINVDLADLRTIFNLPGTALMSVGEAANDKDGAVKAARGAIQNRLPDLSVTGAQGVLFTVKGGPEITLGEVNTVGRLISQAVSPDAVIFFGMSFNPDFHNGKVRVTIIATGIPDHTTQG